MQRLIQSGRVAGPVLELGVGYGGDTCRALVESSGLRYYGTDMNAAKDVDFVANFERAEDMAVFQSVAPFSTILILNVLEHTFDPIRILDHARTLVRRGGTLVVVTPAIWPLHNFPFDAWRILPNFYEEYTRRTRLHLVDEYFEYLGIGGVRAFRGVDSAYRFRRRAEMQFDDSGGERSTRR